MTKAAFDEDAFEEKRVTGPLIRVAAEPRVLEIDNSPQLFADDHLVDNRWGLRDWTENVVHIFHRPLKDQRNPVIAGRHGYVNVARDDVAGLFRMWYQDYWDQGYNPRKYTYGVAYAESKDGIHWSFPRVGRYEFKDTLDNNIVLMGRGNDRAETQWLLDVPAEHRRGYRYVMLYNTGEQGGRGLHLIGSNDGIEWDPASDVRITIDYTPDTQSSIIWDPSLRKFVCFTRATNIYRTHGQRRKIARLEHTELWGNWPVVPENILLPDAVDARSGHNYFYGMPVKYYGGIYWGFLWPYRPEEEIYTELVFSRDGRNFQRLPDRPRLIEFGPRDSWDHGMVFGSPDWIEIGDEWWIYYSGTNGPHREPTANTGIGLLRLRKEGFISLRSPEGGGVVVTRMLRWPGGKLFLNADARKGELSVRVTGYDLQPIRNFDPGPSLPIKGDRVRHEVKWGQGDISALKGMPVRLEFTMKDAVDLYGFQAMESGDRLA